MGFFEGGRADTVAWWVGCSCILLAFSSGFSWYFVYRSADMGNAEYLAIDIVHGFIYIVFGVLGVIAGCEVGYPGMHVAACICLLLLCVLLISEIALYNTTYACGAAVRLPSPSMNQLAGCFTQVLSTGESLPPNFALSMAALAVPCGLSGVAGGLLILLLIFAKVDGDYS